MARAAIFLTVSSLRSSWKLGRIRDTVGTFTQSRLPGIAGVLGPGPTMIPVSITMETAGAPARKLAFEVIDDREVTPLLVAIVTATSLVNAPTFADEMTMGLSGRIELDGHPDLLLNDLHIGFTRNQSAAVSLARQVQGLFGAVYQNRFEIPDVRAVELSISSIEKGRLAFVESVHPTRTELKPGDDVEFRVLMRHHRGDTFTRTFRFHVPEGTPPGQLVAYVGGSSLLGRAERNVIDRQARQADDLDQLISLINRLRTRDKLYLKVSRRHPSAVVQHEVLPALPPSVLSTLGANKGTGDVTPLAETTIFEEEISLDQLIVGGRVIRLRID